MPGPGTEVYVYGSLRAHKKSHHLLSAAEFLGVADVNVGAGDAWCLASELCTLHRAGQLRVLQGCTMAPYKQSSQAAVTLSG